MTKDDYSKLKTKYDANTVLQNRLEKKKANLEKQIEELKMKRMNQWTTLRNYERTLEKRS